MGFLDDPFEMSMRSLGFGVQSVLCPVKIICRCFAKRLSCQEVILFTLGCSAVCPYGDRKYCAAVLNVLMDAVCGMKELFS